MMCARSILHFEPKSPCEKMLYTRKVRKNIRALLFLFILFFSSPVVFGQSNSSPAKAGPGLKEIQEPLLQDSKNPQVLPRGFDIVLLMDSSGSMRKTDPQLYRKPAARLFISLLGEDDRIAVFSFGDSAKRLLPLTENSKKNRQKLFQAVDKVSSDEFSTHIHEAVKKGLAEVQSSPGKNRILILMSDGKLTLGSKEKDDAALRELSTLLPELAKENIKLYTIAFTEMSDVKLMEEMARATGGFFRMAKTDQDIHTIFAALFEKIKSPNAIPLEGDTFLIDPHIQEAILLITKKPGTSTVLFGPAGEKHSQEKFGKNLNWHRSKIFDLISIKNPAQGKWRVRLSSKVGNRIFVVTNLSLNSSLEKNFVTPGEEIRTDAWLERDGEKLTEKEFLEQISFAAEVTGPDGKMQRLILSETSAGGNEKARGGTYSSTFLIDQKGEYAVRIVAESKAFRREKIHQFSSTEKPPSAPEKVEPAPVPEPPLKPEVLVKPTIPSPAQSKPAAEPKVSWLEVLKKFGLINIFLLLAVLVFRYRKKLVLKWPKKKKEPPRNPEPEESGR